MDGEYNLNSEPLRVDKKKSRLQMEIEMNWADLGYEWSKKKIRIELNESRFYLILLAVFN